jgi:esterase/lipase superfamily enzyme
MPARPNAQSQVTHRLVVPGHGSIRSPFIALTPSDLLQVGLPEVRGTGEPAISVYVYGEDRVLAGRDDPDSATNPFVWQAPRRGNYYVVLENTADADAVVTIDVGRARAVPEAVPNHATVRVFFATDRQRTADAAPAKIFGIEPASQLTFGFSDVSIPREHRMGELEGPSIWRLEFRENPEKHVVLLSVRIAPAPLFLERLAARLKASPKREALLFVHGFNVTFDDAARRAAQLSYDLGFDGPTALFSWPSQGSVLPLDYTKDQRNADLSADSLKSFLQMFTKTGADTSVHVIAHSMGNRVLAGALERLASDAATKKSPLRQVALIAPDIDAELFRRAAGNIAGTAERVTLYASSEDAALKVAQRVAGYRRAGQAGSDILVLSGIDTVDASSVNTSLVGLGHAYYADNSTILSDLFSVLRGRKPPERFGLTPVQTPAGTYWRFQPAVR